MNNLYYYLFPEQEGLCLPPCKGKKKGKKAKKKAKKSEKEVTDSFSETVNEINEATSESESYGNKSICNPSNLPSVNDIGLLKGIIEISEQASKNVEERSNLNDLYKEYEKSVDFNSNYKDNLIKKENNFYSFAFGEANYDDLYNLRLLKLNNNDLSENEIEQLIDDLSKLVYINTEINKNEKTLEKTRNDLIEKKENIKNDLYNIENNIYVDNRDSEYENENFYYTQRLSVILTYIYIVFLFLFAYIRISNSKLPILYELCILGCLALLPTVFYDNIIRLFHFFLQ